MDRYVCIHGHFYQPPRENPWLESIEMQDSAYPYHDWNERITAECYGPNATARILDEQQRIRELTNNYAKISFNFGPTLLSWIEANAPEVYQAILDADRESRSRFSGHGSALAQAYNHMILPLANRRDKVTQVRWGARDFVRRFQRAPEGMWLPETAVDLESLEVLAEQGIAFTILAPHQARRVRPIGGRNWRDVTGGHIDPTMAYQLVLPSGKSIAIFFYDGPISRAVAFEGLLSKGENLAQRLAGAFREERDWYELVHIATDGESYGHHHRFGEMALAYALHYIESNGLARLTNYGEYLERHPPTHQVEIYEQTSWSCAHGIGRWWSDCGCNSGAHPDWNQQWRTPLRNALDWLRDTLAAPFETHAKALLRDPWQAREDYIDVILDRTPENVEAFFRRHAAKSLNPQERSAALKLLELQRHALLMYTSCGWFFDELSGLETVQVLHYAGRAVQLARETMGLAIEEEFLARLAAAKSNLPEYGDGRRVYERLVRPSMVDLERVTAHYGVSSLFESYPDEARIYCYSARRRDYQLFEAGRAKLAIGRVELRSDITYEAAEFAFGVLHFGDHNLTAAVCPFPGAQAYGALVKETIAPFNRGDLPEVIRLLDRNFSGPNYTLRSLFRDEQRKILDLVLASSMSDAEALYRQIYEHNAPLMRLLTDLNIPSPRAFRAAAEVVLNANLRASLESADLDPERIGALFNAAKDEGVPLDRETLEFALGRNLSALAEAFKAAPVDLAPLRQLAVAVGVAGRLPLRADLWKVQNIFYRILQTVYPEMKNQAALGSEPAREWVEQFVALGRDLRVALEA
ncbi:MAG TPA: DUF3536 domain-containing protein [Candidatus Acidoferrales bacterium]|nr:DUF3536 domain-containing protein [Candidatus Acidoferrales bacterium]